MIIEKNKNTFEDLLGLEIETEDKFLNKKLNSNVCYLGGGGGGGQKQQDIAPTLRPFVTDVLERAKAEFTQDELAKYPGERVVGFSDEELDAQKGILGLVDRGISSDKRLSSADTYYDPALGLLKKSGRYTDKGASEITADEIQSRMNPYTQAVLDIAKRKAADEAALYDQQLSAQAAKTGGFGGSRQAILEARAKADLGSRLSDIQVKGMEAAYNDAIRAAEAARGRQFQAAQGLGALSGQYGNLGQQALGQAYREQGYRSGVGEAQRGLEQQRADISYRDFVEERDFPARQLERYAGIAFGVPQGYLQQPGPAAPSAFQQFAGGVTTVGGLGRGLGFFKEGGNVGKVENGLMTVYRQSGSGVGGPKLYRSSGKLVPITELSDSELISMFGAEAEKEKERRGLLTVKTKQKGRLPVVPVKTETEPKESKNKKQSKNKKESDNLPSITSNQEDGEKPFERSDSDLLKIIRDAAKVDTDALEKAAKTKEGFAIAGLGLELMGKPLAEIDSSKALSAIADARAAKEGIPAAARKAEAEGVIQELEARGLLKELGTFDLVPEFTGIDDFISNFTRGMSEGNQKALAGPELVKFKRDAQQAATMQAYQLGIDPDSEKAKLLFQQELEKRLKNFNFADPSLLSRRLPNAGQRADNIDVDAQRFER